MSLLAWSALFLDAAVITVLLRAGAGKLVAPDAAAAALDELLPGHWQPGSRFVRLLATLELVVAMGLAIPALGWPAHLLVGLLGLGFCCAGTLGMLRGSNLPCGCLGTKGARPLGMVNALEGLGFLLVAAPGVLVSDTAGRPASAAYAGLLAVILSMGWLLVEHRRDARDLLRNLGERSEATT